MLILEIKDSNKNVLKATFITKEVKICVKRQIIQAKNGSQWFTYFKLICFHSLIMTYIYEVILLVWSYMLIVKLYVVIFLFTEFSILEKGKQQQQQKSWNLG